MSNEEIINAEASGHTQVNARITREAVPFHHGGSKKKWFVDIDVGQGRFHGQFVERNFLNKTGQVIEAWKDCKKAGLPVVPTFRRTDSGNIVMTNLKADGSEIYGRSALHHMHGLFNERRKPSKVDSLYLDLVDSEGEIDKIRTRASEIAELAAAKKIGLAFDDPLDLVLHPDGSWNLVMLDMEYVEKREDLTQDDLKKKNMACVNTFMSRLTEVRDGIKRSSFKE